MKYSILFTTGLLLPLSAPAHTPLPPPNSGVATKSECVTSTSSSSETVAGLRVNVVVCRDDQIAWITVTRSVDNKVIATESKHFSVSSERVRYGFGVENIVDDALDRFHVQFTYGDAGTPTSDIFRFIFKKGKWRASGRDHDTTAECGDGSIGDGSKYSINYLTGRVIIDDYNQCRPLKTMKRNIEVSPVWLSQFDPFDSRLEW